MLPSAHRMRRSTDFAVVVRSGRRARRGTVVVHQVIGTQDDPIVGLIVGKSVGPSVVRHRVSRRLRAQLADRLGSLPAHSATVIRALPSAADASSAQLSGDIDAALARIAAG